MKSKRHRARGREEGKERTANADEDVRICWIRICISRAHKQIISSRQLEAHVADFCSPGSKSFSTCCGRVDHVNL